MQKYDTSRVSEELQKELSGSSSNLKLEVENLVKQFTRYEEQVITFEAQNQQSIVLTNQLDGAVKRMEHAIKMIAEILYADASDEQKVKLLKAQVKAP